MFEVRQVAGAQTWTLRGQVLRPNWPPEKCGFVGDEDSETFHLAAFDQEKIVGIATFMVEENSLFPKARYAYRLRGMASHPEVRRQGVGRKVIYEGMTQLRKRGCDLLWFNARVIAFPFYEALGFSVVGELLDLPGTGPHKIMFKFLESGSTSSSIYE